MPGDRGRDQHGARRAGVRDRQPPGAGGGVRRQRQGGGSHRICTQVGVYYIFNRLQNRRLSNFF